MNNRNEGMERQRAGSGTDLSAIISLVGGALTLLVVQMEAAFPVCKVSMYPNSRKGSNRGGIQGHEEKMIKARQLHTTKVRRVDWKI